MTALVTKHLPLVAGAPDGIKRLRGLILELAVRGRLVDQDPSDEPAVELLKRINEGKSRFDASRSKRSSAERPQPSLSAPPNQAPAGWTWTTFGASTICRDGERVPVSQVDREVRAKVYDYYGASGVIDKIDNYLFDKPLLLIGEDGANLINRATPIAFIARGQYWVNNHAHVIDGVSDAFLAYMALYINAIDLKPYVTGTAQPKMNQAKLNSIPVPLPPEPEQHRIVAKVDELMALCDRLEADQADAEAAHARLVQALLGSLTQSTDAADFRPSWQRLSEHFHTLFTTESSIDALKQTVLQLAVIGKLVSQVDTDESASSQLEAISSVLRPKGPSPMSKKSRVIAEVESSEQYAELPNSWVWTRLGAVVTESGAGWSPSCESRQRIGEEWGVLKVSAVSWGEYRAAENKALPANLDARPEHEVQAGDFLVSRANTAELVARSVVVESTPPRLMLSDKIVRLKLTKLCNLRFIHLVNSAPASRAYYSAIAGGTSSSMKNVSREQILGLPLPLPPLAEQHRIVAKVDELMALCDQLKAQLQQARQQHAQLASVLVEQAVA